MDLANMRGTDPTEWPRVLSSDGFDTRRFHLRSERLALPCPNSDLRSVPLCPLAAGQG